MGRGMSGRGSMLKAQVNYLETSIWKGYGKAKNPNAVKVGDVVDLEQYKFKEGELKPVITRGVFNGEYNGHAVKGRAKDVSMRVTDVQVGKSTTTLVGEKLGGAPATITKTFPNDQFLRTYKQKKNKG